MNQNSNKSLSAVTPVKFHFARLTFKPSSSAKNKLSRNILTNVITYLQQQQVEGKGIMVDKFEKRDNNIRRPLFITGANFMLKEQRISGSLALLRTGRIPKLKPHEKFVLIPIDTSKGEIAEQTHFFIDYSTEEIVICIEFNNEGPRLSDLEFYFRVVAHDKLKLARGTSLEVYMDYNIDKTLAELKNVLNFEIKIQPRKLSQLDTVIHGQYFTAMSNFGQYVNPKFIKFEALFQTQGKQYVGEQINKEAVSMIQNILRSFKAKPTNIGVFDNFVVKYEDKDGNEEVFNLLKGKKEIIKRVNFSEMQGRMWYELIEADLDSFVESRKNA